jgi:uncharacterized surface protein with fasciclin (FAS1) repeats
MLLKKLSLLALSATILCSAVFVSSCKKSETVTPATVDPKNVVQVLQSDSNYNLLVAAVVKTDLAQALSDATKNYTVFAPKNNAFRALGIVDAAVLNTLTTVQLAELKSTLLYHVLGSKIKAAGVPAGPNANVATLNTASVYVTNKTAGVFVNGNQVKIADIDATNGVIHSIDAVLLPATGNLKATLASDPNFSLLVTAVLKADSTDNAISNALTGAGPLTVFAPTNAAFSSIGLGTQASINAKTSAELRKILLYHVVAGRVFSSDLSAGNVPTVQGQNVTIGLTGGATVTGVGNAGNPSKIIAVNALASNGVIHQIDRVLLP